jgi:hypothetical protein
MRDIRQHDRLDPAKQLGPACPQFSDTSALDRSDGCVSTCKIAQQFRRARKSRFLYRAESRNHFIGKDDGMKPSNGTRGVVLGQRSSKPPLRRKIRRSASHIAEALEPRMLLTGTWSTLTNPLFGGAQFGMLLSDGSVMVHGGLGSTASKDWYKLTPASDGSYINGTWSNLAQMSTNRLFFGSNVLPDGRVLVVGGEYSGPSGAKNFTNTGEIYNPVSNTWSSIADFPQSSFGDDPTAMLPDGRVLAGHLSTPATFIYSPASNTWVQTGTKITRTGNGTWTDQSDEETWMLLPDHSILSYDVWSSIGTGTASSERFVPGTGTWVDAGTLPAQLSGKDVGDELGGALLLPDGRAMFIGAHAVSAFYNPSTNAWSAGPDLPAGRVAADAPCAILPNGKVLMALSPQGSLGANGYEFPANTYVYEYDPTIPAPFTNSFTQVTPALFNFSMVQNAYQTCMLALPTGQIMFFNDTQTVAIYTPEGSPSLAWRPSITGVTISGPNTFALTGKQLNGISEGASYGDDNEMASNYPIVRYTDTSNHIFYGRTFNWNNTGVATAGTLVTTNFTKQPMGPGGYKFEVIANGIPSRPILDVEGTSNRDIISIDQTASNIQVTVNGVVQNFSTSSFTAIVVHAQEGDDDVVFSNLSLLPATVLGDNGNDQLFLGSPGDPNLDRIVTQVRFEGGNDRDAVILRDSGNSQPDDTYTCSSTGFSRTAFVGVAYSETEEIRLEGGSGANSLLVNSTAAGCTYNLSTGGGADFISIGNGNIEANIPVGSVINIDGHNESDTMLLSDIVSSSTNDEVIDATHYYKRLIGAGPDVSGTVNYTGVEQVTLGCTNSTAFVLCNSTAAGVNTIINLNDGDDTIWLSNSTGDAANLAGTLTVDGGPGTDSVVLFDGARTDNDTFTITSTTVTRNAPGITTLTWGSGVESLTIGTGSGKNTFNVQSTRSDEFLNIYGGPGDDVIHYAEASTALSSVAGSQFFDGQGGINDTIDLHNSGAISGGAYTITASTIADTGFGGLNYTGSETINLFGRQSVDTFGVNSTAAGVTYQLYGNKGNDTFNVGSGNFQANIVAGSVVNIDGQDETDTVNLLDANNSSPDDWNLTGSSAFKNLVNAGPQVGGTVNYFGAGDYENLTLSLNGLGTFVRADSTAAGTNTVINLNGGDDTIWMAYTNLGGDASSLAGAVSVTGGSGIDNLVLFDSASADSDDTTINAATVSQPGMAALNWGNGVEKLYIDGATGDNGFFLDGSGAGTQVSVTGGAGNDFMWLTNLPGNLDLIGGPVIFDGQGNLNSLIIADDGISSGGKYTVTSNNVNRTSWSGVTYSNVVDVTLGAQQDANQISVNSTAPGVSYYFYGNDGADEFDIGNGDLDSNLLGNSIHIDGGSGNDTVFLDDTADAGTDNYNIIGSVPQDNSTFTKSNLAASVIWTFVDSIVLDCNSASNNVAITTTLANTTTALHGNGGADTITVNQTDPSGPVTLDGGTGLDTFNINTGALFTATAICTASQDLAALNLGPGGSLTLTSGGNKFLSTKSISSPSTGKLDLSNNAMIVDYDAPTSPINTIKSLLTSGYANGAWNGIGINSSVAATTPNRALGFAEATDIGSPSTFAGQSIDNTSVLITYTLNGDANLDKKVDVSDLGILATNWQGSLRRWSQGDFNFDQKVDVSDLGVVATNWQGALPIPSVSSMLGTRPPRPVSVFALAPVIDLIG